MFTIVNLTFRFIGCSRQGPAVRCQRYKCENSRHQLVVWLPEHIGVVDEDRRQGAGRTGATRRERRTGCWTQARLRLSLVSAGSYFSWFNWKLIKHEASTSAFGANTLLPLYRINPKTIFRICRKVERSIINVKLNTHLQAPVERSMWELTPDVGVRMEKVRIIVEHYIVVKLSDALTIHTHLKPCHLLRRHWMKIAFMVISKRRRRVVRFVINIYERRRSIKEAAECCELYRHK